MTQIMVDSSNSWILVTPSNTGAIQQRSSTPIGATTAEEGVISTNMDKERQRRCESQTTYRATAEGMLGLFRLFNQCLIEMGIW